VTIGILEQKVDYHLRADFLTPRDDSIGSNGFWPTNLQPLVSNSNANNLASNRFNVGKIALSL
jgi:hypothetical protein